jgi:hypothetical protein
MAAFIPEKLYGTFKVESTRADGSERILGFVSPFGKDSAFKKRQHTQLKWAYQDYHAQCPNYHMIGGQLKIIGDKRFKVGEDGVVRFFKLTDAEPTPDASKFSSWYLPFGKIVETEEPIPDNITPKVFDNVELEGFRLAEEVRRIYWGGGNVVWRVEDPRGFELEISSANLARILDCSTISNGVIQDKCIWGRDGAQNILLPVSSDIYKESNRLTSTIKKSQNFSLKDLTLGDSVKIVGDDRIFIYYGNYKCLQAEETYFDVDAYRKLVSTRVEGLDQLYKQFETKTIASGFVFKPLKWKDRYALKCGNTIMFVSTPKIAEIVCKTMDEAWKDGFAADINENRSKYEFENFEPIMLSTKAYKDQDVSVIKEPMSVQKIQYTLSILKYSFDELRNNLELKNLNSYNRLWGIARHKETGLFYAVKNSWDYSSSTGFVQHTLQGQRIFEDLLDNGLIIQFGNIENKSSSILAHSQKLF